MGPELKEQKEQVLGRCRVIPVSEPRTGAVLWSQVARAAEPNSQAENLPGSVPVASVLPDPQGVGRYSEKLCRLSL